MKSKIESILWAGIIMLCLFYFVIGLIYSPVIYADAIHGMLSLHNYLNGSDWNKILSLSKDGSHLVSHEMTWWAPGQYQIPYILSKLCFVNIGTAIVVLVCFVNIGTAIVVLMFISLCGGCYFYYKLFKISGLKIVSVLYALLILLLQRFINTFFVQYNSSDLLLFFYTPFYIYAYYTLVKTYPRQLILKLFLLAALNYFGLFIKNSFILFELALNTFLIAEYFFNKKAYPEFRRIDLFKKLLLLIPFILPNILNYYFFLRLGGNPANGRDLLITVSSVLTGLFIPVMETLFASLSLWGIWGIFHDKIRLSQGIIDILMAIVLLMIAYLVYNKKDLIIKLFKKNLAFRFTIIVSVIYVLLWFTFIIKRSAISYEDRLYLPVTILLLPFLVNSLYTSSKIKYLYIVAIGISVTYGISTFVYRIEKYISNDSVFSKDQKLNGFKVYSKDKILEPELNNISNFISSNFAKDYVIISNEDFAFELNVTNRFIIIFPLLVPVQQQLNRKINYIVLVRVGIDPLPSGLKTIYSTGKFILYK